MGVNFRLASPTCARAQTRERGHLSRFSALRCDSARSRIIVNFQVSVRYHHSKRHATMSSAQKTGLPPILRLPLELRLQIAIAASNAPPSIKDAARYQKLAHYLIARNDSLPHLLKAPGFTTLIHTYERAFITSSPIIFVSEDLRDRRRYGDLCEFLLPWILGDRTTLDLLFYGFEVEHKEMEMGCRNLRELWDMDDTWGPYAELELPQWLLSSEANHPLNLQSSITIVFNGFSTPLLLQILAALTQHPRPKLRELRLCSLKGGGNRAGTEWDVCFEHGLAGARLLASVERDLKKHLAQIVEKTPTLEKVTLEMIKTNGDVATIVCEPVEPGRWRVGRVTRSHI